MQKASAAVSLGAMSILGLAGCGGADDKAAPEATPAPPAASPTPPMAGTNEYCELALFYRQELEKLRSRFDETHPDVIWSRELAELAEAKCAGSVVTGDSKSGKWVQKDGILTCDGFMTRRADQDYCSAEVPGDWVPFEFDGQVYFLQPLQGSVERQLRSIPQAPSGEK